VGFEKVGGDVPCAAVDQKNGGSCHKGKEKWIVPFWNADALPTNL
jgi:hypothetical protein